MKSLLFCLVIFSGIVYLIYQPKFDSNNLTSSQNVNNQLNANVGRQRMAGPIKIALQAGHWKNRQLPEELKKLRENDGAQGAGKKEWEVNLKIAEETAEILRLSGFDTDILPATIPPSCSADVFVSIHADEHPTDKNKEGFKVAGAEFDKTGKSNFLAEKIEIEYQKATKLKNDENNITDAMKYYYAFSWWRFDHTINPHTPAVIIETGYLPNPKDQQIIIDNPQKSGEGIANGIKKFLNHI